MVTYTPHIAWRFKLFAQKVTVREINGNFCHADADCTYAFILFSWKFLRWAKTEYNFFSFFATNCSSKLIIILAINALASNNISKSIQTVCNNFRTFFWKKKWKVFHTNLHHGMWKFFENINLASLHIAHYRKCIKCSGLLRKWLHIQNSIHLPAEYILRVSLNRESCSSSGHFHCFVVFSSLDHDVNLIVLFDSIWL